MLHFSPVNRLRVLHCLETIGSGGVEQRRLTLALGLDPDRYEQAIVCTQAIGGLPDRYAAAGCRVHEIGVFRSIYDLERYRRCLAIVRQFRPHIIHGAVYEGVALAAVVGRLAGVPVIIGEETSDPVNRRWRGHILYRVLCALTHQMIAVSPAVREYLVERLCIPDKRVALISNGVAKPAPVPPHQVDETRAHTGLGPEHFVIGTVGRLLDSHKRVSDLIIAMPSVLDPAPQARLLIVGSGPDEASLLALAKQLGVADRVVFTGYQADPAPFYALMDLFALGSAHEAFGLVLVEAMLRGIPVVATRVGGIPHVVAEGEAGLLVEAGRPQALAAAILELIHNPAERRRLGRNGRIRADRKFSATAYVQAVDALYTSLTEPVRISRGPPDANFDDCVRH